jgi:type II secretory pathway component PulK
MMKRFFKRKSGIALIFVLGTVVIISVLGIEMTQRTQISKMMVVERRDSVKALELAKAGFRWSMFRIQMDQIMDKVPVIPGTNYGGKKDDLSEIQWTFPLAYPFPVPSLPVEGEEAPAAPPIPEDGTFSSQITDESSKINLNDVFSSTLQSTLKWTGTASILVNLLASPRFSLYYNNKTNQNILDLARAVDDWTDNDNQVNYVHGGDENAEYAVENGTYKVKNGPFYTLEEIRLLKPMSDKLYKELEPFVTVYPFNAKIPRISTQLINPLGKLNINTAPIETLAAIFSQAALPNNRARLECAQNMAKARAIAAFRGIKKGGTEPSLMTFLQTSCGAPAGENSFIETQVLDTLDVKSDVFRIQASGFSGNIEKKIEAVVLRSATEKPKVLYWKVY